MRSVLTSLLLYSDWIFVIEVKFDLLIGTMMLILCHERNTDWFDAATEFYEMFNSSIS